MNALQHKKKHMQVGEFHFVRGGGLLRQRCGVAYVTRASNWGYWLTVGQGLISLQQVRVEGDVFIFLFLYFHSVLLFHSCPSL